MLKKAAPALLVVACVLAYAHTFSVPFLFDDFAGISQNTSIERFSTALAPPVSTSLTGRPAANVSLALNYAISRREVWSYHALNLALHIGSALALFAIVGRALRPTSLAVENMSGVKPDPQWPTWASSIAFATALLWSLHPLQSASVTYLMQRTELLMSFCYLLTLYCFIRGACSPSLAAPSPRLSPLGSEGAASPVPSSVIRPPSSSIGPPSSDLRPPSSVVRPPSSIVRPPSSALWLPASLAACALGMAAKEVMVTAPLVVLLYDRTFLAGSFRAAWRTRAAYYTALAATWLVLFSFVLGTEGRGESAGFNAGVTWTSYALTQLYAITHYLRLALWPSPLIFDYGTGLVRQLSVLAPCGLFVAALITATLVALRRRPALGFCGAWFFLLLAPTSSVVPVATQTMAEHRMYLALAAPVLLFVVALHRWLGRGALAVCVPLAIAAAIATHERNRDYRDQMSLWSDTAAKKPDNARAQYNLGIELIEAGRFADAASHFQTALQLEPAHIRARHKLGLALFEAGRPAEALPHLEAAVRLRRINAGAHYDLARALLALGRPAEAVPLLNESIRLDRAQAAAHFELGNALVALGRPAEALAPLQESARLNPTHAAAHYNLGHVLTQLTRYPEALAQFEEAARLAPNDLSAANNAARLRAYLQK